MSWDTHEAWPPVRYIAHAIQRSVRQTQKCLRRLEESGELVVRRRTGASNIYILGPRLVDLAKRLAAGERGLWEKFSTGGDDTAHPSSTPDHVDVVHLGHEEGVRGTADDAVHPKHSSTVKEQSQDKEIELRAKQLAKSLIAAGVEVSRHDAVRLEELVRIGAHSGEVLAAIRAASRIPGVKNALAYGAQTLINKRLDTVGTEVERTMEWSEVPWQVVVAHGERLGVGTWDPNTSMEQFLVYKGRVTDALRRERGTSTGTSTDWHGIDLPPL
ncbi:hypothetical protein EZ313_21980 [Ramlibacter henchirensis]|uniref:Uncharacterized protein n=1 Tax=Ramlibacter henchirensis TaxID=204072 RepID=A0A4Z0BMQ5_9BURK|nr:hypothetical protein [Ramlibacter henchirensis]TFY99238.1 hypothetical protein EZ313_21980 [Ramlibacter henchirensis]